MNRVKHALMSRISARAIVPLVAVSAVATGVSQGPVGQLVAHFHISDSTATQIVTLIVSGGLAIDLLFPWVIPVVGTVQALIIAGGTGLAVGW